MATLENTNCRDTRSNAWSNPGILHSSGQRNTMAKNASSHCGCGRTIAIADGRLDETCPSTWYFLSQSSTTLRQVLTQAQSTESTTKRNNTARPMDVDGLARGIRGKQSECCGRPRTNVNASVKKHAQQQHEKPMVSVTTMADGRYMRRFCPKQSGDAAVRVIRSVNEWHMSRRITVTALKNAAKN